VRFPALLQNRAPVGRGAMLGPLARPPPEPDPQRVSFLLCAPGDISILRRHGISITDKMLPAALIENLRSTVERMSEIFNSFEARRD
jgi:hypothetical protein